MCLADNDKVILACLAAGDSQPGDVILPLQAHGFELGASGRKSARTKLAKEQASRSVIECDDVYNLSVDPRPAPQRPLLCIDATGDDESEDGCGNRLYHVEHYAQPTAQFNAGKKYEWGQTLAVAPCNGCGPVAPGRPDLRARKKGVRNANGLSFRLCILHTYASIALRWPRDGAALLTGPIQDVSSSHSGSCNGLAATHRFPLARAGDESEWRT